MNVIGIIVVSLVSLFFIVCFVGLYLSIQEESKWLLLPEERESNKRMMTEDY